MVHIFYRFLLERLFFGRPSVTVTLRQTDKDANSLFDPALLQSHEADCRIKNVAQFSKHNNTERPPHNMLIKQDSLQSEASSVQLHLELEQRPVLPTEICYNFPFGLNV